MGMNTSQVICQECGIIVVEGDLPAVLGWCPDCRQAHEEDENSNNEQVPHRNYSVLP